MSDYYVISLDIHITLPGGEAVEQLVLDRDSESTWYSNSAMIGHTDSGKTRWMNWSDDLHHASRELIELDAGSEVVVMRLIDIYRVHAGDDGKGLLLRGMFPPRSKEVTWECTDVRKHKEPEYSIIKDLAKLF